MRYLNNIIGYARRMKEDERLKAASVLSCYVKNDSLGRHVDDMRASLDSIALNLRSIGATSMAKSFLVASLDNAAATRKVMRLLEQAQKKYPTIDARTDERQILAHKLSVDIERALGNAVRILAYLLFQEDNKGAK